MVVSLSVMTPQMAPLATEPWRFCVTMMFDGCKSYKMLNQVCLIRCACACCVRTMVTSRRHPRMCWRTSSRLKRSPPDHSACLTSVTSAWYAHFKYNALFCAGLIDNVVTWIISKRSKSLVNKLEEYLNLWNFHVFLCGWLQFGAETQQSKVAPSSAANRPIQSSREQVGGPLMSAASFHFSLILVFHSKNTEDWGSF